MMHLLAALRCSLWCVVFFPSLGCASIQVHNRLEWAPANVVQLTEDGINVTNSADERIEYDEGETVSWTVVIDDLRDAQSELDLEWIKNGEPLGDAIKYETIIEPKQTALTIRNLTKEDDGNYQLMIKFPGHQQSINFTLQVKEEPSYFMINYTHAEEPNIGCWIYSRPPIMGLSVGQNQSILHPHVWRQIFHLAKGDDFNISNGSVTIYLRPPKKTGQPSEITDSLKGRRRRPLSKYADQFQLSCTSSTVNNTSIPDITWSLTYDNGSYTELNISQLPKGLKLHSLPCLVLGIQSCTSIQMLMWRQVSAATEGVYSVTAFDSESDSRTSLSFEIRATKEPSIYNSSEPVTFLQTGDDVVLFCQSEGYPLPVPYWSKNGSILEEPFVTSDSETSLLSIPWVNLTVGWDSVFTCRFENIAGADERSFRLQMSDERASEINTFETDSNTMPK